jgi:hypothetical protein
VVFQACGNVDCLQIILSKLTQVNPANGAFNQDPVINVCFHENASVL